MLNFGRRGRGQYCESQKGHSFTQRKYQLNFVKFAFSDQNLGTLKNCVIHRWLLVVKWKTFSFIYKYEKLWLFQESFAQTQMHRENKKIENNKHVKLICKWGNLIKSYQNYSYFSLTYLNKIIISLLLKFIWFVAIVSLIVLNLLISKNVSCINLYLVSTYFQIDAIFKFLLNACVHLSTHFNFPFEI